MILIDGDKLADTFKDNLCDHLYCRECSFQLEDGGCKVEKWLDDAPTIEPKQGAWINKHEWANGFNERECSICGAMKPILMHTAKINFCPNCGARMREREGE